MKCENLLLVSDIDGTLIDSEYQIPRRNREAIQRFMEQGGGFSIATGRSWESVEKCLKGLRVNRPCVLANGGLLYDMERHQPVSVQALPPEAMEYAQLFLTRFPQAGVEVFTNTDVWVLRGNDITRSHMYHEGLHFRTGTIEDIQEPWCKVLVAMREQEELITYTRQMDTKGVRFVASSDRYWEMLPEGADKGSGIRRLAELYGYPMNRVAAIGDYYNDLEMLQTAGITAVPQNAPEELKQYADLVVCHCCDGAVADFVEFLESYDEV